MRPIRVCLDQRLKRQLAKRARGSGKSVSEEMRNAVDFYLQLPFRGKEELIAFLKLASCSADRTLRKLDETISYVNQALKPQAKVRKRRVPFIAN
jgi:Ribbon-helix-helix protein, copG family